MVDRIYGSTFIAMPDEQARARDLGQTNGFLTKFAREIMDACILLAQGAVGIYVVIYLRGKIPHMVPLSQSW